MKRAMALLFSVLLAASLCFTGCGGKQETKGGSGGGSAQATEKAAEKPAEDPIPGLYRVESFAGLGAEEIYEMMGAKNADEFRDSMTIELKEGGKGVANFDSDPSEITWKVENGVITMQDPGDASQTMTGEVKDGVMKLTIEGESIYLAKKGSEKAALEVAAASGETSELAEMFNCETLEDAIERRDEIIADYSAEAPDAVRCLDEGFDDAMTVMALPEDMRRCTRTSNYLERLNKEVKRRSKVIGIFPNAASAVRLMGAFLMEENDRWAAMGKMYYSPACKELEERRAELVVIARRQQDLRKAA